MKIKDLRKVMDPLDDETVVMVITEDGVTHHVKEVIHRVACICPPEVTEQDIREQGKNVPHKKVGVLCVEL